MKRSLLLNALLALAGLPAGKTVAERKADDAADLHEQRLQRQVDRRRERGFSTGEAKFIGRLVKF